MKAKIFPAWVKKTDIEIGKRIRSHRTRQQLTQRALAKRVGISVPQILKYEKGKDSVSAARLLQIAKALDVPMAAFFEAKAKGDSVLFLAKPLEVRFARTCSRIIDKKVLRQLILLVEAISAGGGVRRSGRRSR